MGEKAKIRAYDGMFLNSKGIFVEYVDIIKAPYFMLLFALIGDGKVPHPFTISDLRTKSFDDLLEWYYLRNNQNIFIDLLEDEYKDKVRTKDVDRFLDSLITKDILEVSNLLNFGNVLNKLYLSNPGLSGTVYIWYPFDNKDVIEDIKTAFSGIDKLKILTGDIVDALKEVPDDSTYVFSDASNINVLEEIGKLDFSSIIIPEDYEYNKNQGVPIIDYRLLAKDHVFKINKFFATITQESFDLNADENAERNE